MAVLDSLKGNYKAAFAHHKLFVIYRDSLDNEETQKKTLQASMGYEFDKKEIATKAEQDKKDAIALEEKQKQQLFLILVTCILILVGVFAVFMYRRFKITQRQKAVIELQKQQVDKAYAQLDIKNKETEEQKKVIEKAFKELHEKNEEVMASIRYGKRIQDAMLTREDYIHRELNRLMREGKKPTDEASEPKE